MVSFLFLLVIPSTLPVTSGSSDVLTMTNCRAAPAPKFVSQEVREEDLQSTPSLLVL